jgi:hypothetical protein
MPFMQAKNIIELRHPTINTGNFDDITIIEGSPEYKLVSTYVIAVITNNSVHYFLHDGIKIRQCLWDRYATYNSKQKVASRLLKWLNTTHQNKYSFFEENDMIIFDAASIR